jgi:hypothetical protein
MSKENWKLNNLYAELPEREGITTLFRKFDTGTWIVQYKGDQQIGMVLVHEEDMQTIHQSPCIQTGDGKTPQSLPPGDESERVQAGHSE